LQDLVEYPGQTEHLPPMVPITPETMKFANSLFTFAFTVEFFCRVMAQVRFHGSAARRGPEHQAIQPWSD
jgi:hypothetical protein